jgi:hypothetical protein
MICIPAAMVISSRRASISRCGSIVARLRP